MFLDITATLEDREATLDVVSRTAEEVFIPLTVGGGVRTDDDVHALLRAGADKVSVNSAAVRDPSLLSRCADRFGTQCMVVAIDAKRRDGGLGRVRRCRAHARRAGTRSSGRPRPPPGTARARSCSRRWTATAPARATTSSCCARSPVPSRCRWWPRAAPATPEHFAEALTDGRADAVLAASRWHDGDLTIREVKEHLASRGIPVRL